MGGVEITPPSGILLGSVSGIYCFDERCPFLFPVTKYEIMKYGNYKS